jgi:hypothetical protein
MVQIIVLYRTDRRLLLHGATHCSLTDRRPRMHGAGPSGRPLVVDQSENISRVVVNQTERK